MGSSETDRAVSPESASGDLIDVLDQARRRFLALVADVRPDLHRYCARMTGSVASGEDVVQEVLARAYYELSQSKALPPLRPWLFRIAHNRAIDHLRHEAYRAAEPMEAANEIADVPEHQPDRVLEHRQAMHLALVRFLELAPAQRACVILKDVLDHSLDDIADELGLSVPAVKAALHRGRTVLQRMTQGAPRRSEQALSPALLRYATLFNARDWDGVRALLADDVRLDLVSQRKAAGRRDVGTYFSNYDGARDWHLHPAWLDGREVLAVSHPQQDGSAPRYFIELGWIDGRLALIRDFRYVPYITQDGSITLAG
jgi:RNA polymerase sigma-70 factor (ECF subfamily)